PRLPAKRAASEGGPSPRIPEPVSGRNAARITCRAQCPARPLPLIGDSLDNSGTAELRWGSLYLCSDTGSEDMREVPRNKPFPMIEGLLFDRRLVRRHPRRSPRNLDREGPRYLESASEEANEGRCCLLLRSRLAASCWNTSKQREQDRHWTGTRST